MYYHYKHDWATAAEDKLLARVRAHAPQFCTSSYRLCLVYTGWVSLQMGWSSFLVRQGCGMGWEAREGEMKRVGGVEDRATGVGDGGGREFRHPQEMRERSSVWNKLPGWDVHHLLRELERNSTAAAGGLGTQQKFFLLTFCLPYYKAYESMIGPIAQSVLSYLLT